MSSAQRNLLFFGSVGASVIGQEAHNKALLSQLEGQSASLQLRLTATAASFRVEEVLGLVSASAPLPLKPSVPPSAPLGNSVDGGGSLLLHTPSRRSCFLPLMLELARDPAADGIPSESDSEADGERPSTAHGNSNSGGADEELGYYAVTVTISVDVVHGDGGGGAVMIRSKQVVLPSVNKHAARDTCTVVQVPLSSRLLTRSTAPNACFSSEEVERDVASRDVAASVYVMLRVIDLSERVGAAEEAVDDMQRFLGLPPPIPRLSHSLTKKIKAPYGAIPLVELYKHYRLFYSRHYSKVLKPSNEVVRLLTDGAPGLREANESYPYRWNALEEIHLDRVLLGEEGFAPLLLTLSHCTNLRALVADRNQLGDATCARLCALLSRARYLRCLSLVGNNIYEGGADQLLRLARRNHRLTLINVEGNQCSEAIQRRIADVTAASQRSIAQDPLNIFAEQYGYLASPHSIPGVTLKLALSVWAMLTAAPVGDIDVWVRNSTTKDMDQYIDESLEPRQTAAKAARKAPLSVIPPAARAPLLSEVMRTVYVGVCMAAPDPLVRSVFVDLEEARRKRLEMLRSRADAKKGKGRDGSDDDDAKSDDSLAEADEQSRQKPPMRKAAEGAEMVGDLPAEVARVLGIEDGDDKHAYRSLDVAQLIADTEDDIYNASFLKIIVTTMRAVASGSPWGEVQAVLQGIGVLHRSLGVRTEDYWLATHVIIKALSVTLGPEDFTSERLAAFLIVLALGIRTVTTVDGAVPTL